MRLKRCIFDGYHEKDLFAHLNSMWKDNFNIYPQLPFTKIFDIETLNISQNERDFLLKTNIDYTICDKEDKPLMCIEFDGWSHGYNRGGEYIQIFKKAAQIELILLNKGIISGYSSKPLSKPELPEIKDIFDIE